MSRAQVGSDGKSQAFGNPEDVGCRLTKYWVLLENEANNQTHPRRHVIGRENAAFALDGENDGDLTIPRFLTNTSATQRPNDEVKPDLNSVADKNNKIPKSDGVLRQAPPGCICNHDVRGSQGLDTRGVSAKDAKLRRTRSHGDVPRLSNKSGPGGLEHSQGVECSSQTCPVCSDSRLDPRFSLATTISPDQPSDDRYDDWRLSLEQFTSKRFGDKRKSSGFSKGLRSFYKKQDNLVVELEELRNDALKTERSYYKSQDDLITQYEDIRLDDGDGSVQQDDDLAILRKKAALYAKITFAANLMLLAIKVVAVVLSGSISLISSLVDSSVDLVSGVVIWATTRAIKKTDYLVYPQGRSKLEPLAIVILSTIMSLASVQIIKESCTKFVNLSNGSDSPPVMDWVTIGIASITVVLKLILFIMCHRVHHPTVQALAQDHRNDVLSNTMAIAFGYIGSQQMQVKTSVKELVYLDPAGALAISVYIIVMWCITGWDQIKLLVGHTATPEFLSKITWICMDHHQSIQKVDTVRAFHFGNHFLVEADIVLPPEMTLREAHDIGQPLQQKLERIPTVERAFVHIDYEAEHNPKTEHKVV